MTNDGAIKTIGLVTALLFLIPLLLPGFSVREWLKSLNPVDPFEGTPHCIPPSFAMFR